MAKQKHQIDTTEYEDDGHRYEVHSAGIGNPDLKGTKVYVGDPVSKGRAEYLADGLVHGGILVQAD